MRISSGGYKMLFVCFISVPFLLLFFFRRNCYIPETNSLHGKFHSCLSLAVTNNRSSPQTLFYSVGNSMGLRMWFTNLKLKVVSRRVKTLDKNIKYLKADIGACRGIVNLINIREDLLSTNLSLLRKELDTLLSNLSDLTVS